MLALDARWLKTHQKSLSWVYNAALRCELAAPLGVDWQPVAGGSGQADLAGVLTGRAMARCEEFHPTPASRTARRRDGRPFSEHVTDRRLTTPAVLTEEANLLQWAATAVDHTTTSPAASEDSQRAAARAVAGARLVPLARTNRWRLVCVGDPPSSPRWAAAACSPTGARRCPSTSSRRCAGSTTPGRPRPASPCAPAKAATVYAEAGRLRTAHPATLADQVARQHDRLTTRGRTVAFTTASAGTARVINVEIQHRRNPPFPARRWPWRMPAGYVARHVELGWATTGYGTVDTGIAVEPSATRAGIYVAMTRGRLGNLAWIADSTGRADPADALAQAIARPPNATTAHASATASIARPAWDHPPQRRSRRYRPIRSSGCSPASTRSRRLHRQGDRSVAEGSARDFAVLSGLVGGTPAQEDTDMAIPTVTERRPLMDLPTVAKYLGVSERHIRRLVQERRIPFIKWGHPLRFDPDEIDVWVDTKARAVPVARQLTISQGLDDHLRLVGGEEVEVTGIPGQDHGASCLDGRGDHDGIDRRRRPGSPEEPAGRAPDRLVSHVDLTDRLQHPVDRRVGCPASDGLGHHHGRDRHLHPRLERRRQGSPGAHIGPRQTDDGAGIEDQALRRRLAAGPRHSRRASCITSSGIGPDSASISASSSARRSRWSWRRSASFT